jgi:predicted nucleotidyltransferase
LNPVEAALRAAATQLDRLGRGWALVGGLAVSAHGEPRTTRDVDLVVAVRSDADAEALVFALSQAGFRVEATLDQNAVGRLATVRLRPPTEERPHGVVVDILFASSGIEPEVVTAAERVEIVPGLTVPLATRAHLIALKVLSRDAHRRPRDDEDLRNLLRETKESELAEVRRALDLIAARGFARGKDLEKELAGFLG